MAQKINTNQTQPSVVVDVNRSTTQNLTDATWATILFNTEVVDNYLAYDNSTGLFTVPAGQGGRYEIDVLALLASSANNTGVGFQLAIQVNSVDVAVNSNIPWPLGTTYGYMSLPLRKKVTLAAGDIVRVRAYVDVSSGTPTVAGGAAYTYLQIQKIY